VQANTSTPEDGIANGERMTGYRRRVVDTELSERLSSVGAVLIEGPRACGKTETARQFAESEVLLDIDLAAQEAVTVDPRLILAGSRPRLIDEWQLFPTIWNHVRRASDEAGAMGQFILTGSSAPTDDITRHSGAGRISRLRMRPMSLLESGASTGEVSVGAMLRSGEVSAPDPGLALGDLVESTCRGGWPGTMDETQERARRFVRDYVDEIRRTDVRDVDRTRRDPALVLRVLRSLGRNVATEASLRTIAADAGGSGGSIDPRTVKSYLGALERVFIVENQPAWTPHLRSRSQLRHAAKMHFVDPSLAVAALRTGPDQLMSDLSTYGFLFESLVVRDLRVHAQANDADVFHYRDNTGLEVDAVVEAFDGGWMAFEVKLGGQDRIDEAASNLLRFRDRVDTSRVGEPSKLGVITATGYAIERSDGIAVIPIGTLGP
jgi:predicted AAA+ superfamily ATPase